MCGPEKLGIQMTPILAMYKEKQTMKIRLERIIRAVGTCQICRFKSTQGGAWLRLLDDDGGPMGLVCLVCPTDRRRFSNGVATQIRHHESRVAYFQALAGAELVMPDEAGSH